MCIYGYVIAILLMKGDDGLTGTVGTPGTQGPKGLKGMKGSNGGHGNPGALVRPLVLNTSTCIQIYCN